MVIGNMVMEHHRRILMQKPFLFTRMAKSHTVAYSGIPGTDCTFGFSSTALITNGKQTLDKNPLSMET